MTVWTRRKYCLKEAAYSMKRIAADNLREFFLDGWQ